MKTSFEEALSYAASCCSRSELCEADILRKITLFQLTEQEQTDLIARLKEMGFIDSERYARAYVSDKFRFQHWGRIKISYQLKQKGLEETCIEKALQTIDEAHYEETLMKLLQGKAKQLGRQERWQLSGKLFRWAASRGFETSYILRCLNRLALTPSDSPEEIAEDISL